MWRVRSVSNLETVWEDGHGNIRVERHDRRPVAPVVESATQGAQVVSVEQTQTASSSPLLPQPPTLPLYVPRRRPRRWMVAGMVMSAVAGAAGAVAVERLL